MRKIILSVAVSLDGFIEDSNGNYDWCPPPSPSEMNSFLDRIDTLFMGRKSFELFEPKFFPCKKVVVFSDSLRAQNGVTIITRQDFVSSVSVIKNQPGKDIWLFGGASLTATFINEGLIDEMWLALVPILLGGGKSLFQNSNHRNLFFIKETSNKNGYVSIHLHKQNKL